MKRKKLADDPKYQELKAMERDMLKTDKNELFTEDEIKGKDLHYIGSMKEEK